MQDSTPDLSLTIRATEEIVAELERLREEIYTIITEEDKAYSAAMRGTIIALVFGLYVLFFIAGYITGVTQ